MGYFEGAEKASIFEKGVYFDAPGKYKLQILTTKVIDTREKGLAFIADFKVLESSSAKDPVGSTRNWYQGLQKKDVAFGSLKSFAYPCLGLDWNSEEGKVTCKALDVALPGHAKSQIVELLDEMVEQNTMAGTIVLLETSPGIAKTSGKPITNHRWSPAV